MKGLEMDESLKPDHQGAPQGEWGDLSFSLPAARLNMWAPDAATKLLARLAFAHYVLAFAFSPSRSPPRKV
ncbi:hypothetical protein X739_29930 [Mesorhizobium sp. LNHC220B00]|nr:hypothetical protein X739_29930 [Mesorhizobium sp. LNHC220B00]